jgi:sulfhydrogenase subunit beta (sulfur reductase)
MIEQAQHELRFLARERLQTLIDRLVHLGHEVIGPKIEQQAVVYRRIDHVEELPRGWSDDQEPAVYRLTKEPHDRYFGFNTSPDSWKRFLYPPTSEIGNATLKDDGWHFETPSTTPPRYAFLGVRACDLAAIAVQDRVFAENQYVDVAYKRRRQEALIIAVQCSTAASTCFCSSMGTGPECNSGYDLVMTELNDGFVVQAGTDKGVQVLDLLPTTTVTLQQLQQSKRETDNARKEMTKQFNTAGIHDLLLSNLEHPQWKRVAERCLSCANCTMVCPTCFCSSIEEVSNLAVTEVTRVRNWDSCFNIDFSYIAGGVVRNDIRSRYRQWLTHKLATWHDQFDVSGCVGCGRCITWCPVGIDLTEEVDAIRSGETASGD